MMNKVLLSLLVALSASPAIAVTGKSDEVKKLLANWGGGSFASCGSHMFENSEMCIGATKSCTEPVIDKDDKVTNSSSVMHARDYTDEYALQMMVAIDINEHGARFCPIQVEAKNENHGSAWTEYAMIGSTTGCQWLCKDGYSGDNCMTAPAEITRCNPTEFKRGNYDSLNRVESGANIEDDIAMFSWNVDDRCGKNVDEEHDSVLAITRWATGGHGAWVQPVMVRAQHINWDDMISWPVIYSRTGATEQLVCVEGYKPNAGGTDCVAVSENLCTEVKLAPGWTGFNKTLHKFVIPKGKTLVEFRCKGENMAFASATDHSCVECITSLRSGVSQVDGTCVECEAGKVFNSNATTADAYCGDAYAYTKTDMQYGKGKTKNDVENLKDQCWTKTETDDYRACVMGTDSEQQ